MLRSDCQPVVHRVACADGDTDPHAAREQAPAPAQTQAGWDFGAITVLALSNLGAAALVAHQVLGGSLRPAILVAAAVYTVLGGLSITGGYHRYYAHRSYRASKALQWFYLLVGAGTFQNSVLSWAARHRRHHRHADGPSDPYGTSRGFWHAHLGWMLRREGVDQTLPEDLEGDPLVRLQAKHYLLLAALSGLLLPAVVGALLGSWLGGLTFIGFARIAALHHCTFLVNSGAHYFGAARYDARASARDSLLVALFTYGEGFHSFHHRFPADYRCGVARHAWDPTKWFICAASWLGLTSGLRRIDPVTIANARAAAASQIGGDA